DGNMTLKDSVLITVNPLPNVHIGGLQDVCQGSQTFTLYGGVPSGGTYTGPGVSNNQFNPNIAGVGNHIITYTATNSFGCSNSNITIQKVHAKPNVSLSNFAPICETTPTFSLSGGIPVGGNYFGIGVSNNTFNAGIIGVGTHTINYSYTDGNGCSDTAINTISVQSSPVANAGNDTVVNYSTAASLKGKATGGSGNFSYLWQPSSLIQNPSLQNTQTNLLTASSEITLHVTDNNTGCSDSDKVLISVSGGQMTSNINASATTICGLQDVQLSVIAGGGTGNYTYSWSSSPTGFSSTVYNPVFTPTTSTTFYVAIFDGQNTIFDSITIFVYPIPVVDLGNDTLVCGGGTIVLNAGQGFQSYLWSNNSTNQTLPINLSMLPTGTYQYSVEVTNANGCDGSDTILLSKDQIPYVNLGPDDSICFNGGSKILDAGYGFDKYLWSTGDTNQMILVDGTLGLGQHPVWVDVYTNLGCKNTDTIQIKVVICGGISEYNKDYKILVYPNPATGIFNINIEGGLTEYFEIEVFNMQGQIVFIKNAQMVNPESLITIDISEQPAGMYFLRLKNNHLFRIERLIKQ
ncbi:MAG: T9SS type A sorting domain-containing protein, partial [Bacteroidales bacterium]|nr:T9SS type A sorting domain-containing protein [Bacteroidales bacterium]